MEIENKVTITLEDYEFLVRQAQDGEELKSFIASKRNSYCGITCDELNVLLAMFCPQPLCITKEE